MAKSISRTEKKRSRGRPKTGAISIHLRIEPKELEAIDGWRAEQNIKPTRPEAIRRLIEQTLAGNRAARPLSKQSELKASKLAARELETMGDQSQPVAEQQRRKRTLIRGPKEFRDIRADLPKPKS